MNSHDIKLIENFKRFPFWAQTNTGILLGIPENLDVEIIKGNETESVPLGKVCRESALEILSLQEQKRQLEEKVTSLSRIKITVKA